ncbi:hypothetical protein BGZ73_003431 [Actinomortierella ambigua]|nr:hypothetical protein BGZ73_003431 [Actinomortierella ambigua]
MPPAPTISRLPKRNSTSLASSSRFNGSLAGVGDPAALAPSSASNAHLQLQDHNNHSSHHRHQTDADYEDDLLDADDGDRSTLLAQCLDTTHRINDSFNQPAIPFESDMPPILPLGEYATDEHSDYTSDDDDYTHSEYDGPDDEEEEDNGEDEGLVRPMDSENDDHQDLYQQKQQPRRSSLDSRHSYSSKDNTASTSSTITNANTTPTANSATAKAARTSSTPTTSPPSAATSSTPSSTLPPTTHTTNTSAAPSGIRFASRLQAPVSRLRPPSQFSRTTPISSPLSQEIKHEEQDPDVTDQDDQDDQDDHTGGYNEQQTNQDHLQTQESAESGLHARYLETEPDWMQEDEDDNDRDEHLDVVEDDIGGLRYDPASSQRGSSAGEQGQFGEEEVHGGHARLSTIAEVSELPSMTSITHHLPHSTPSQLESPRFHQLSTGKGGSGPRGGVALGNRDLQLEDLMDEQDFIKERQRQDLLANLKPTDILGPLYETQDFKISSITRSGPSWENNEDQMVPNYDHDQPEGSYSDYSVDEETDLDEEAAALKREYEELFGKGEAPPLAEIANSDIFLNEEDGDEDDEEDELEDDSEFGDEFIDSEEERYFAMLHIDNGTNRILENNIPRVPKPLEAPRGSMLPVPSSFGNRSKSSPPAPVSNARFPSRPPSTTPPSTFSAIATPEAPMPSLLQRPNATSAPLTTSQSTGIPTPSAIPAPKFAGTQSLLRRNQEIAAARQAAQQEQLQQRQQPQQQASQAEKPMGNILDGLWDEPSDHDSPDEMSPGAMHAARIAAELMRQEREEKERRASTQQDGGEPPRRSRLPPPSGLRPPMAYAPIRPSPLSSAAPIKAASRSSLATSEAGSSPEGSPRLRLQQRQPISQQQAMPPSPSTTSNPTTTTATSRIAMGAGGTRLTRPSSLYEIRPTGHSRLSRPSSMYDTRALTPPSPPQEMQAEHYQERLSPKSRSPKDMGDMRRFGSQSTMATTITTTARPSSNSPPHTPSTQTFCRQNSQARKLQLQREIEEIEAMEAAADAAAANGMIDEDFELRDRAVPSFARPSQTRAPAARTMVQADSVYDDEDDGQDPIESREVSPRSSVDFKSSHLRQHQQQQQQRPLAFTSSARTTTTNMHTSASVPAALSSSTKPSRFMSSTGNAGNMYGERKSSVRSMVASSGGGLGLGLSMANSGVQGQRRVLKTSGSTGARSMVDLANTAAAPALRTGATLSREASSSISSSSSSVGQGRAGPLRRTTTSATTLCKDRMRMAIPTLEESYKRLASIRDEITKMRQEIHEMTQSQDQSAGKQPHDKKQRGMATAGHSRRSSRSSNDSNSGASRTSGTQSRGSGSAEGRRHYEDDHDEEHLPTYERVQEKNGRQYQQQQQQQPPAASTALTRSRSSRQLTTTRSTIPMSTSTTVPSSANSNPLSWDHCGVVVCFVNPQ